MSQVSHRLTRHGFTLVEMLVVIAIIGILAGLLIPVVMNSVNSARYGAHKLEIDTIAEAVEKYRNKYGDYPPDGSSWSVMERHLRKAFPQIIQSELDLLNPAPANLPGQGWGANPWTYASAQIVAGIRNDFDTTVITPTFAASDLKVMDPAEALVFFLGGFSSNPQRPFTGDGGPFVATGSSAPVPQTLQYNVSRSNPFFEFNTSRLTLKSVQIPGGVNPASGGPLMGLVSNDEEEYQGLARDLLPVYLANSQGIFKSAPIVYFDSRTYWLGIGPAAGQPYVNYYQCAPLAQTSIANGRNYGSIRPLISDSARLPPNSTIVTKPANFLFVEEKKFQVISPGIDGYFGGRLVADIAVTPADFPNAIWKFPSGESYLSNNGIYAVKSWVLVPPNLPPPTRSTPEYKHAYQQSLFTRDNCANFSASIFAQGQP
jgi:type II secretion system protein G